MDVTRRIQIAVAWADYLIVRYGFIVVRAAGLMLMAAGLRAVWRFLER